MAPPLPPRAAPPARARSRAVALACAAALCAGCATARPAAPGWRYELEVPDPPGPLAARVCFEGPAPAALVPGEPAAARYLLGARRAGADAPLPVGRGGAIDLSGLPAGACVAYAVDLAALVRAEAGGRQVTARDGAVALDPGLLLWRPRALPGAPRAALRVATPAAAGFSSPWPEGPDGALALDASAFRWPSRVVLGRFEHLSVDVAGARLEVAVMPGPRRATAAGLRRWLAGAADAVAQVYGAFPEPRAQVVVVPVPGRGRPVVFGMALRGGGATVVLLLAEEAEDADLPGEWIAIHEMFHLGMPFIAARDAWLSEGVTMLYSEVLRSRAGFVSPRDAWQRVLDGFARGRRSGTGRPLLAESAAMHETGSYHRVYWAGSALALRWDLALREASGGARGLDDALRELHRCCAAPPRAWTADEVMARLDAWWGAPLFSRLAEPWLATHRFPDVDETLDALGVGREAGRATLDDAAPAAAARRALADPPRPAGGPGEPGPDPARRR